MKLQVLITTMNQSDSSIYAKMRLSSDAIIANQCAENKIDFWMIDGHKVKMISTNTKGASRNRNIALANSFQDDDLIMFSDDDLRFNEDYESLVIQEFINHPEADAIKFNLHDRSETRKITMKRITKFEKATRRNMGASGVCGVVIKKRVLDRLNLKFREDFGPGVAFYYKGEDTIFLQSLLNNCAHVYRSPVDIASIDQTDSTWFRGYDEQFFMVSGAVLAACYPLLSPVLILKSAYSSWKRKNSGFSYLKLVNLYFRGMKKYCDDWKKRQRNA